MIIKQRISYRDGVGERAARYALVQAETFLNSKESFDWNHINIDLVTHILEQAAKITHALDAPRPEEREHLDWNPKEAVELSGDQKRAAFEAGYLSAIDQIRRSAHTYLSSFGGDSHSRPVDQLDHNYRAWRKNNADA